ncbi:MAG TPA: 16S rRNA (guanine(966)-N(2))-methyltransferase RsmD [Gemmatimonadaceae bacterium]|nr:16S rRNA (guanine(966)-N(2))-methyltransferase RsmD [Gemmatimonadaceae bacterium]
MRIVSGRWRGRRISAPKGTLVRPTLDRVREAWMSILQLDLPSARVLDLYAGSGALGLEALSRGAKSADFVEKDPKSLRALAENVDALGAGDLVTVHRKSALGFAESLGRMDYDVAFADPPYAGGDAARLAERWLQSPFSRVLSVEHSATSAMPSGGNTRKYGSTAITFYRSEE